jgi:hypothetical protein
MALSQNEIDVRLLNGSMIRGVATGNNAAWLCPCERAIPSIGRSGLVAGPSDGFIVKCPDCSRSYFVVPEGGNQKRVAHVREIDTRAA